MRHKNKSKMAVLILVSVISSKALFAAPSITSLTPTSGVVGTTVTIKGTNFGTSQGTSAVTFNGTPATPTTWANTSIKVPVPAGATTGNVVVTVSGVASAGASFTVLLTPSITSLTPSSGPVGAVITIAGTNFGATQGASTVVFNKTAATPTGWSNTSIQVPVPTGAATGNVVVTVSGVASNGVSFTVLPTPTITSLTPTSGAVGTSVTIKGTNFGASQGTSTVTFNGTPATPTTWAATSIKVPVPAGATTGNVVVTVSGVASNGASFTALLTPSITSLTPSSGPVGGVITIAGTNFGASQGTSTVVFNKTAATPTSWSNTSIQVPVPTGAATGNVVVTVSGVASNGISFTVLPTPTITSLTPTSGAVGTSITIAGTNFGTSQGTSTVTFNGTPATPTTWAATSIKVPVPAGATTGPVVVTVSGVPSGGITFTVFPSISSLSPASGPVGASVTINGLNFGSTQGTSTVTFNGTTATPSSWSATSIVTPVPSGASTGNVVVTVGGHASNGASFTVVPPAAITSLLPASGAVGVSVTITGMNFGSTQGASTVTFNGTTATPSSWSATSIVAQVPNGATTGPVVVTVSGVPSNGVAFTVSPSISSLSPASGAVGSSVTIAGLNFGSTQGTSTVTFNGTTATPSSWSSTSIVAAVPSGATTGNVVVTVGGVSSAGVSFTVLPTPAITNLSPTSGAVGTPVTIAGTNFGSTQGASTVTFNGTAASPATWSGTSIVVQVPSGATTGNVVVTVSGVSSNGASFVVLSAPTITNVSPASGAVGTSVTISGTNFGSTQGASTVTFNGTAATPTTWNATSIVVPVPAGATTGPISVTVSGQTAYSASFTVTTTTTTLPPGWSDVDVGAVGTTGNASYANGSFTVNAAGTEFGGTADAFHFVYQPLSGDGSIVARVLMTAGTGAQGGVMIRESLDGASANANTIEYVPYGALVEFNVRAAAGESMSQPGDVSNTIPPYWVELVRSGSTLSSYASPDGVNWTLVGSETVNMTQNVYVGLVATSGYTSQLGTVTFDNVSVSSAATPAPVITSVSATTGAIGSQVAITGANFGPSQGSSLVTLNATPVTINSWSNTSISITIPAGATSGLLVVSVAPGMNDSNPVIFTVTSQPLPAGWLDVDVGAVGVEGSAGYANGTFTVNAAGNPIGSPADAFHFVYQLLSGDGSIVARVVSVPTGAMAGVMIRETLDPQAANGATFDYVPYGSVVEFSARTVTGGSTSAPYAVGGTTPPYWVQLVRSGSTLSSYASPDGVNWTLVGNQTINMAQNVYAGLVMTSGTATTLAAATFDNVSVSSSATPAPVITSVSATSGSIGSTVVLSGNNFGATQGSSLATLNAIPVTINSWSNTSISITIPAGATSGLLVVSVAPGMNDSNAIVFTVTTQALPSGWLDGDVGAVGLTGSSSYASGTFTLNGAGSIFGSAADAFHFVYQPLSGDGSIVARVVTIPTGAMAGVMIRETLDPESVNGATVDYVPYGAVVEFTVRAVTDSSTSAPGALGGTTPPYWLKLVRSGSTLTSSASPDGVNWTPVWSQTVNMAQNVYVGLVLTSGAISTLASATFDNVSVSFNPQTQAPSIANLAPNTAVPTGLVTITGTNFGSTQGTSTVTFNGAPATAMDWSPTRIVAAVPSAATSGNVVVTVAGAASNAVPFTVSQVPYIASLSLASGTAGTFVTITGVNFGSTQGTSTVTFNGTAGAPTTWNASSIVVPVPSGATSGSVVVTVGGAASNGVLFTILQTPSITSLSATSATIGASLAITGTNLGSTQGTSTVTFNGTGGTPTTWSATSIVVPVPLGATTGNVVVTVNGVPSNPVSLAIVLVSLPPVALVKPANASTGVPENSRVIVRFTQPVQSAALVSGTVSLFQGVNTVVGTLALSNDGLSMTFTPALNLSPNTKYTVVVTDVTGNQTVPEFQSSFTTGSSVDTVAPLVVQDNPQNGSTDVPISVPIVVQFSQPMDPATLTPQAFTVTDIVTGNLVPGMIQVDPTGTTASFIPQGFLGVGRTFYVELAGYLIDDYSGNQLTGSGLFFEFTTVFTADTTAPQMLGISPSNGATAVPTNALIVLGFSKPLDAVSVPTGVQVESAGQPVPGAIALSNSNQLITFTPSSGLAANTTYTVVTTSEIADVGGLALSNPGSYSLTTGSVTDTTTPSVTSVSPGNSQVEVPVNGIAQVKFSKPVDPLTVNSTTFYIQADYPGVVPLPGTIAVSADGQTATFTPSAPLDSFTTYVVLATNGITDVEGHTLTYFQSVFTTGLATDTSSPTVLTVSPANGATGVPVNVHVDLVTSVPLSAASVGNNAVVVSSGGVPVSGAVSLSSSGTTLTFVPANLLAASTTYTVTATGFTDQAGNPVAPFTGSFTTGTSGIANTTTPAVLRITPSNGAAAVSVSSTIELSFNEPVDATTVNDATVPISVNGAVLAGSYTLDGTAAFVTFTPLSPLPGNATVIVQVNSGLLDLSGNAASSFYSTFTTGTGTDTTAPVVTMVTPQNGATGIGQNVAVVLTFSKSLNPSTINLNNFAIVANGSALGISTSASADNRVVTLNAYGVPVSTTITVLATSGVTDLSGNALTSFESQFTTGPAVNSPAPTVVSQRPGNGATGVPLNASVVLYMSEAMNASSVQAGLQVSQNGVLVSGTTQVTDNGQVIQFTPSTQWQPSGLVQVFLTPTAVSANGNSANNYQASFTTVSNPSTTAPVLVSTNPIYSASGVPTNVVMDFAFNEALDPTTLTSTTVSCSQNGAWFQTAVSLVNGGALLVAAPRLPLEPNTAISCQLGSGIQGVNGLALSIFSSSSVYFNTGAGPDTVVPTIVSVSPPNGSSNVGDNAYVRLVFSKPVNPLTVNASTILLSGGGVTLVPDSISFSNSNQSVLVVPHAPLPDATLMTLTISGVTDVAGNAVAPQATQFTTGTGPDVTQPVAVSTNPFQGATNVPLNASMAVQTSEPIDPGTVNSSTLSITTAANGLPVAGTYSVSTDGQTITFLPSAFLSPNATYILGFENQGITDLAGNLLTCSSSVCGAYFTTGTTASTSTPQVVGVSPSNGMTAVPINAQAVIQFNEPVDGAKLAGVSLTGGSGPVNVSKTLSNGNQYLTLVPALPLSAGATYTLNISGVQDLSGNVLASPVTATFTTSSGPDLAAPKVASVNPADYATGVPTNAPFQVQFSKIVDPLTVTATTFQMYPYYTNIPVAGTISVSANGETATLTPNQPLDSLTFYAVQLTNGILDMEGQALPYSSSFFTTATGTTTLPPTLAKMNPAAAFVGGSVTISGTYFGSSQGTSSVTFNGVPATTTSWSDTQIVALVPSGATTGNVVVTVNGVPTSGLLFTILATPSITSISPGSGAAGTSVTITGTNLGDSQDSISVMFNSASATPSSANNTSLVAAVPANAPSGSVNVTVNVNGYSSGGASFTVIPTPGISSVSPNSGVAGTTVYIYGTNFGDTQGGSIVNFNGVPAASISTWNNGVIEAVPPSNVTTGPVTVVENSIPSNSNFVFTVTNPAIGSLAPPSGAIGALITLNGSGFSASGLSTQVLFNGVAGYITQYGSNSLTVQVPSNATSGSVTVTVGTVTSNSLPFTVEQPPAIASISPASGPFGISGIAAPVTITGSGFGATQSTSTVTFFDSNTAPTVVSWSDTSISLWVPPDAASGPFTVQVGGLTATSPSWFYVNAVTQLTDSLGNQSQYTTSIQGGLWFASATQGPGCSTCTMRGNITNTSDSNGNLLSTTDALGNTDTYTYDANNNVTSISEQLNSTTTVTTSYSYNNFGEVLTATDPLGNTRTNTFDANGNLLTVTMPAPNSSTAPSVTQFQYDPKGQVTQITDPLNHVTTLTHTPAGLIATITDPQQNVTSYQYDAHGNRTAIIDALQNQTSFAYDAGDRLITITYPDKSTISFTYDVRGRRTSVTDQNGKITSYAYDDADRLIAITDPANNTRQFAYDTEDNVIGITDADGHTTSFAYNARGWVTQTTFPSTLAEYYAYDQVGNLLSKTDRKGNTIQYLYDALYRLTQQTNPDSTSVEYLYDLAGRVLQVNDPNGTYGFAYDNMGRLIGTTTQFAYLPGPTFSNSYTYDAASNRTSLTAPDGSISTYGYDTLNRINGLANSWAGSFGFSYDALNRRTSITRPNGIGTNYNYDSVSHLLSVLHQAGTNIVDGASYTYDPAGNRTSKGNYLNGITSAYTYDPLYELTQVAQGASTTESYSYDPVGNRLSSSGVPTYSYNTSNELTSSSLGSYTYDNNGNVLTDASGKSYTWDFENRLASSVVPGTGTVTFKYDPFGRRVQKSSPLGTTNYLYDGPSLVEEVDASGNVLARYAQGAGLDWPLAELRGTTTSYYQQDALNSVTSLSNSTGTLASTYSYDSFGNLSASTGTLTNPFQFTAREYDPETKIYYYRARYYDPSVGRFMREDPRSFAAGDDFYAYVHNNPVKSTDPFGLQEQTKKPWWDWWGFDKVPGVSKTKCWIWGLFCIPKTLDNKLSQLQNPGSDPTGAYTNDDLANPGDDEKRRINYCVSNNDNCKRFLDECGDTVLAPVGDGMFPK